MKTNKFILGGVTGGIAIFLLGWIIYGMVLMPILDAHSQVYAGLKREMMMMGMVFGGSLFLGILHTYLISKMNPANMMEAFMNGAVVGLLVGAAKDFNLYGMYQLMDKYAVIIDVIGYVLMNGIGAAVIFLIINMGKKSEA